jgi:DNA polymerase-3 subunit gamma/tau
MFRIEQLEARVGQATGAAAEAAAPAPGKAAAAAGSGAARSQRAASPAPRAGGGTPAAAVAAREPEEQSAPVGAIELERLQAVWPAVAEAVTEENGMLGAALGAARPVTVEADRVTVAFPTDAAFVKKKAEANRELVQHALRGLTGQSLTVAYELREDAAPGGPVLLGEEELIERLRAEFAAEEVFDDDEGK